MISFTLSFENVIVLHRKTKQIIFYRKNYTHDLNIRILELIQHGINEGQIELPATEYSIEQVYFRKKYLAIWKGKSSIVVLIMDHSPSQMNIELVHNFGIRMESRFSNELDHLYSSFQGNIDIFLQDLPTRQNLGKMADEIFQLQLTRAFKINSPSTPLSGKQQEVFDYITRQYQAKGEVFLSEILNYFIEQDPLYKLQIQDILHEFIIKELLV